MKETEQPEIWSSSKMEINITLKLTEDEARALHKMTVYGTKPFLVWFYKHLGTSYLKKHENGLISLFNRIEKELPKHFEKIDTARKVLNKPV